MDLQRNLGVSYLFISHDVSVVRLVCDTVAIMYAGRFVECGDAADIFSAPQHPYTIELFRSSTRMRGAETKSIFIDPLPDAHREWPSGLTRALHWGSAVVACSGDPEECEHVRCPVEFALTTASDLKPTPAGLGA